MKVKNWIIIPAGENNIHVPNHQADDLLLQVRQADRSRQSLEGLLASMGMAGGMAGVISH